MRPLGTVLRAVDRTESVDPTREYRQIGVRLDGAGPFLRETRRGSEIAAKRLSRVASRDFIYSRLFAWRGAFGVIPAELDGCYVSSEFPTFVPSEGQVNVDFLNYWFRLPTTLDVVEADCTGSTPLTRNRFKEKFFLALRVPLPPLAEQRRIVAKIETLAAKIDEARHLRLSASQGRNAFPTATLGSFFRKLARTSSVLPLGQLTAVITDGPHKTPHYAIEGVPFVTVKNMVTGRLDFSELKFITPSDHIQICKRCRPERGDVLYSKDGATRGWPCFVDTDREFNIFVSVALIKPLRDKLDGRFLCHLLKSGWIRDRMADKSRGDMIPHIVLREISDFPVPVPPLPEQRRIVGCLDDLQSKVDRLKALQARTAAELDALLPSILDKAFKGEL